METVKHPKIAILILAHKNENQVNRLIHHLAKDFDVYIHIDTRSGIKIQPKNNIHVYRKFKVYWGSFDNLKSTLFLLREAHKKHYNRYILISGQDLPIKSNAEISTFFANNSYEYIELNELPKPEWHTENGGFDRVSRYYPNRITLGNNRLIFKILFFIETQFFRLLLKVKKRPINYAFAGGEYWMNLSGNCVNRIFDYMARDKKFLKRFKWTYIPEELFFQTAIHTIGGLKVISNSLRFVNWVQGALSPRTLIQDDYEKIIHSDMLFARKFDENEDRNIIDSILEKIK
ncbi:MAG: beta-1,6-N-acetylglucosaminyltransferase [Candidatus Symbiothrix sp.]|jgi:hypothetical protein|nr:beta-1,6-N-acetylglucosaminyltransferase [Candidatus Symbiothrix sp.]